MNCYLCDKTDISVIKTRIRYSLRRNVLRCNCCGLVFLEPRKKELNNFYNVKYRKLYTPVINKPCSPSEIFNLYLPYQYDRVRRFRRLFDSGSRVLEIGCSAGHFLYALKKQVKECIGIEINRKEADFARRKCKVKIFSQMLEDTELAFEYFDVIFLFETLEHLDDPLQMLGIAKRYLKPGGYICVQVPNVNDCLLSVYKIKGYENFYYHEPHLFYFSPKTLSRLMSKAGYKGKVSMLQQYGLLNHVHWQAAGSPMSSIREGVSAALLPADPTVPRRTRDEINNWFLRSDQRYRDLLCRHGVAETIVFIGKKI